MDRVPKKQKKERRKGSLLVMAALVLAVLGAAFFLLEKNKPLPEPEKANPIWITAMKEDDIQSLSIHEKGKQAYPLVRTEKGMRLLGKEETELRESIVSDMLYAAGNMAANIRIGSLEEVDADLADFGLEEPSMRIVIENTEGEKQEILLGNAVPEMEPEQYFCLSGGVLYTVLAEPCDILFHEAEYLRYFEQPELQADLMDRIEVTGKEKLVFQYTKDGFLMEEPYRYPADEGKMNSLLQRIEHMAFEAYLGKQEENDLAALGLWEPEVTVTLTQAPSVLSGITAEGKSVAFDVAEKQYTLQLGQNLGGTAVYVLWENEVYKASNFLLGFWKELQTEEFLSQMPMNIKVDRLQKMTAKWPENEAVYEVEMVEVVAENNEIATDEYGQTLYDAQVKKNGETMDAAAFLRWYVQVNQILPAGKVTGEVEKAQCLGSLYLQTEAMERTISFYPFDALHAAVDVDGVCLYYIEKDALSLMKALP